MAKQKRCHPGGLQPNVRRVEAGKCDGCDQDKPLVIPLKHDATGDVVLGVVCVDCLRDNQRDVLGKLLSRHRAALATQAKQTEAGTLPCQKHAEHTCAEETTFSGPVCPCCGWTTAKCDGRTFDEANGIGFTTAPEPPTKCCAPCVLGQHCNGEKEIDFCECLCGDPWRPCPGCSFVPPAPETPCPTCRQPNVAPPCGSREFVSFMETGGNCSNCGHALPCHPEATPA